MVLVTQGSNPAFVRHFVVDKTIKFAQIVSVNNFFLWQVYTLAQVYDISSCATLYRHRSSMSALSRVFAMESPYKKRFSGCSVDVYTV